MTLHPTLRAAVAELPRAERFHLLGRACSFPLDALCNEVPSAGRVLEVGCGHGLVAASLALESSAREVVGFDIDPDKIRDAEVIARRVRAGGGHLTVTEGDGAGAELPAGPWDAIVIADVIYLLAPERQEQLLAACAASLAPGGVVVLKENDQRPWLKYAFARFEEVVATKVIRITAGSDLHWRASGEWAALMERAGLETTVRRVDKRYPYPHVLIIGRRPAA